MTEADVVGLFMLAACGIGGMVAWGACLYANHLDRVERGPMRGLRQPKPGEAPSILMAPTGIFGVVVVLLLGSAVLRADEVIDACTLLGDPANMTWAEYLVWLAAGCFW